MNKTDARKEVISSRIKEAYTTLSNLKQELSSLIDDQHSKEKLDEVISDFEIGPLNQLQEELKDFIL